MMLAGLRVMVVEHEVLLAMWVEDVLEEIGCEVLATASRLEDAVGKAQALAMDVAALDVNQAGRLSYPVAEVLRARGIPFVFATGYGAAGLPERLQGVPTLPKPFQPDQLAEALRRARTRFGKPPPLQGREPRHTASRSLGQHEKHFASARLCFIRHADVHCMQMLL